MGTSRRHRRAVSGRARCSVACLLEGGPTQRRKQAFDARSGGFKTVMYRDGQQDLCKNAEDFFGPDGGDERYLLERLARDVRVTRIYEGTSEIQRIVVAREVLKGAGTGGR